MSQPTRDEPPESGSSEHRAGDIVAGRVAEEELDPATIAQLAAWFGAPLPTQERTREQSLHSAAGLREEREEREHSLRATEAVDPAFLARFEAMPAQADALRQVPEPMSPSIARTSPSKFDFEAWGLILGQEPREYERPEGLADVLKDDNTPQAVLRDLYRPELHWQPIFRLRELGVDIGGERARQEIGELIHTRYAVRMQEFLPAGRVVAEELHALRERLAEPWENAYVPAEERRTQVSDVRTLEDLQWFGAGGYDPDL